MKLSVVVCTHNQRDALLDTLDYLWSIAPEGWQVEVVVVDDHSTDGTRNLLLSMTAANLQVIYQPRWRRAACWRAAITHVGGDYVLVGHARPGQLPDEAELSGLLAGVADEAAAVYSAPPEGEAHRRRGLVTWLVNTLFGGELLDVVGASKLVRADVLRALNLSGDGVVFEVNLTAKLLRAGLEVRQVPVTRRAPAQRLEWREQLKALGAVLAARLNPSPVWRRGQRPATFDAPQG